MVHLNGLARVRLKYAMKASMRAFRCSWKWGRSLLAHPARSAYGRFLVSSPVPCRSRRTATGRFDPFAKPSGNDRCLRTAFIRCVVLARVKSPSQKFRMGHYPEKRKLGRHRILCYVCSHRRRSAMGGFGRERGRPMGAGPIGAGRVRRSDGHADARRSAGRSGVAGSRQAGASCPGTAPQSIEKAQFAPGNGAPAGAGRRKPRLADVNPRRHSKSA